MSSKTSEVILWRKQTLENEKTKIHSYGNVEEIFLKTYKDLMRTYSACRYLHTQHTTVAAQPSSPITFLSHSFSLQRLRKNRHLLSTPLLQLEWSRDPPLTSEKHRNVYGRHLRKIFFLPNEKKGAHFALKLNVWSSCNYKGQKIRRIPEILHQHQNSTSVQPVLEPPAYTLMKQTVKHLLVRSPLVGFHVTRSRKHPTEYNEHLLFSLQAGFGTSWQILKSKSHSAKHQKLMQIFAENLKET